MRTRHIILGLGTAGLCAMLAIACTADAPTSVSAASAHTSHGDVQLSAAASSQARSQLAALRQWSAPLHNAAKAAAAGYTAGIGCIDETTVGVPASEARGMGYHVTRGDKDIVGDGVIDVLEPEFLVYAPAENDAQLAPEDRLAAARLIAVEYYFPEPSFDASQQPADILGGSFVWAPRFSGWVRHVYLWGNNPEGINENFNGAVRLCTDPLPAE